MNVSLSKAQFFLLLFIIQTGVVYIAFQTPLIIGSQTNAWWIFMVGSVIHYGLLLFFERNYQYFYLNAFFRWIYQIYWLLLTAILIAYMGYVLASWVLPQTPEWIVVVIIAALSLYANVSRPETVINMSVMLLPIILLFVIFLMLALPDLTWSNLFPVEWNNKQIIAGIIHSTYAYFGIEMYLIYRPYVQKELQVKGKPLFIYQLVIFIFFFMSIVFTQMFFGLEEIKLIPEPIMYILKSQEVTFVKRLDIFFVYIWLSWSIVTVMIFGLSFRLLYLKKNRKKPIGSIVVYHILLAVLPLFVIKFRSIELIKNSLHYLFLVFTFLLPIVIIYWNKWRGKGVS
ncbi:GerAB/ArcD/ProY family transporter [Lysinibacillus irui]|uniref:GerAB/ArcD/ProY family transporter n=1 Tax=Lysinibacillus irui TaxID=2998077 RepID=A0ABU5NIB8_9BACI|nr:MULTISPECIES: GerAB/ArcD/ProY family transporter [Lysinibacillus]MEA0553194.1 GerAB/ArcD/ProY family transporter [Lysinibacillus irui]MEA0975774.1 GerAB/ArcD/ProY family transporter [Lysinibacillus irui]MEA1041928.1 GerAB/ArcD/ProY family transporter [Lysinibacillus irui]